MRPLQRVQPRGLAAGVALALTLTLVIAEKDRVTTISSISGILSAPGLGVYSMSKHAIEAFCDTLAVEMAPLGVKVSLVEPGNYRSEISRTAAERMGAGATSPLADRSQYPEPDEVATAVLHSLSDANPKRRNMVTPNAAEAELTVKKAIDELAQLNQDQPYSFDRKALIEMPDAKLGQ